MLPGCQDTGTALVKGKKGQYVLVRGGHDEEAIARGVFDTYQTSNLRYSQMAPLDMWEEINTKTNLPAEIKIAAVDGDAYKFLFMAKGGGSANKSYLFQETKALLNPTRFLQFLDEKLRMLGTAACPPYHLAIVVGGTSAEHCLEVAKLASTRALDSLPKSGSALGHGFRDVEMEAEVLELTRSFGIGAQFGGKYFCHDVRVIRLPRHGASCPVAIAVSCSADRQAWGKITAQGIFLEELEHDPARFLPEVTDSDLGSDVVRIDLDRPMPEVLAELSRYPVTTRLSLTGTLVVARDIAHARIKERLDDGEPMPQYLRDHAVYYAGPAKTPAGYASGSFGPTTAGRMDSYVDQFQAAGGSMVMLAKGNRSTAVTDACAATRRLLPRFDRRSRGAPGQGLHHQGRGARLRRSRDGGRVEDRRRRLPGVRRGRRQGQRLLQRRVRTASGADPQLTPRPRSDEGGCDPVEDAEPGRGGSESSRVERRQAGPGDLLDRGCEVRARVDPGAPRQVRQVRALDSAQPGDHGVGQEPRRGPRVEVGLIAVEPLREPGLGATNRDRVTGRRGFVAVRSGPSPSQQRLSQ